MTLPSYVRRNITILASVFLLAGCLFGWVAIGHMQKQSLGQGPISKAPAFPNGSKDRPAVGEGRIMYSNGASISVISADPSDQQSSYTVASSFFLNLNSSPTVSSQTGKIAYLSNRRSEGVDVNLVWAMDADGSNPHQVTPPAGLLPGAQDSVPAISPDGTKIAFIARRFNTETYPDGTPMNAEVFVVNFDGSGLHQVTKSDRAANGGTTNATAVAWGSSGLYVSGRRVVTDQKTSERVTKTGIFTFSSGSSTEDGNLVTEMLNLTEPDTIDVSGGTILFARDNILYVGNGDLATYTQIRPEDAGSPRWSAGGVRFSPDGSRIVYSSDDDGGSIKTISSAGGAWVEVRGDLGNANGKWWMPGSMPTPARLEMLPSMVFLPNDGTVQKMTPTLYDDNNNVIFHAASFNFICDASRPCFNGVDGRQFTFFQDGQLQIGTVGETRIGATNFCGTNGGITGCSVVAIGVPNFAEIRGSVPSTNTNGSSGPAVFTIRRRSDSANNAFNVDFTVGGTAVRDLDYALNVVGNSITFQGGQTTSDITVTPLRAAGDKTVTMSITAPLGSSYFTLAGRDSASVNIIDNGASSSVLSLSSVTPASGGNGGVVVSKVFGDNIANGATVKLTRAGEQDLPGANVNVAAGGKSLSTVFDLSGRAVGQWNVVVTNPDLTTASLTNKFTIEPNVSPRLTVQISGASSIRASHTRSRYDVVYTNHGNTDAFGVVLFVTGVAANECVDESDGDCTFLETALGNIPDIPGQNPFPAWVRQVPNIAPIDLPNVIGPGIRQVGAIPVLIPRIPAHGTGTFRFSMRFTSISETRLQRLNAAILPPLVTAVTVPGAAKPTVMMRKFAPQDGASDAAALCFNAAFQTAVSCALGLVPGGDCISAGVAGIQTVAGVVGNLAVSGTAAVNQFSGTQLYAGAVSLMACVKDLSPIGKVLDIISCFAGVYDACVTCLGPDACNPFRLLFVQSADPNEKTGVRRFTSQNFVQNSNLLYSISFENQASATAPAQDVIVTDQLDTSTLDLDTFELGGVSFGETTIDIPAGLKTYSTEVDLRPSKDLLVDVSANLDQNTGLVTWTFHSIDPFTRQAPTDALAGFLPPNVIGTEGAGKVLFTISPKTLLASGTEIRNRARITFDLNPPIDTNEWINTIDDSKPASDVAALPATERDVTFPVTWSGSDSGSGIADYSVFVSDNGAPSSVWLINTSDTTAMFTGQRGHTYSFYSVAQDNAANLESPPVIPDTTTVILAPTAAGVEVSGRISTPVGLAVSNARVSITDPFGVVRTAVTNPFGYYRFDDVRAGRAYVISVRAKQHQFASRLLELNDDIAGFDFVSLE